MSTPSVVDSQLMKAAKLEAQVTEELELLHSQYPEIFKQMAEIEKQAKEVQRLKDAVKQRLIEEGDFDLHEVGDLSVSLSAVAKVKVVDIDQVPDEFKETKTVLKESKARDFLKVMHRPPEGCEDSSYYRLNWRVKKEQ